MFKKTKRNKRQNEELIIVSLNRVIKKYKSEAWFLVSGIHLFKTVVGRTGRRKTEKKREITKHSSNHKECCQVVHDNLQRPNIKHSGGEEDGIHVQMPSG